MTYFVALLLVLLCALLVSTYHIIRSNKCNEVESVVYLAITTEQKIGLASLSIRKNVIRTIRTIENNNIVKKMKRPERANEMRSTFFHCFWAGCLTVCLSACQHVSHPSASNHLSARDPSHTDNWPISLIHINPSRAPSVGQARDRWSKGHRFLLIGVCRNR